MTWQTVAYIAVGSIIGCIVFLYLLSLSVKVATIAYYRGRHIAERINRKDEATDGIQQTRTGIDAEPRGNASQR